MSKLGPPPSPSVLELFAGVGGFRLGLESAGWSTVWSNQWEPSTKTQHASSCYVARFGAVAHSNEDIAAAIASHELGEREIPQADMIVGGFPCQDYSVAKSLKSSLGLEGKKGVLWWQIHRLVFLQKPKFVFLENVDRLLKSPSTQRGRDFAVMLRTLGDLGYMIEWRVVNAAEYGFPQRRIRVLILATRVDLLEDQKISDTYFQTGLLPSAFPKASYETVQEFKLELDPEEISENFNKGGKNTPFLKSGVYLNGFGKTANPATETRNISSLGSVLLPDSEVPADYWVDESRISDWEYLKGAKSVARVSKSGHEYNYSEGKMAFPDSLEKPSRTILTGEGGTTPSRFKHIIKTAKGYRRLLPIELERLNGFPDDWTRYDSNGAEISHAKRAFFMGNALVVGLIEMVGREITNRHFSN